ncbi:conserved hypothetical protein [Candidatus Terasakiella magnetica]|nr:conserved hypothetical protein [Candidatus Terasakiella magnetica]
MTQQVTWNDDLLVNVSEIDNDHRKLFDLMDGIFSSATHGAAAVNTAIGQLATYTREHFSREQASMARSSYPLLGDHTYEHEHLVFQLESLINRLMVEGPDAVDAELAQFLMSWLGDHIVAWDMKYAAYLRETGHTG